MPSTAITPDCPRRSQSQKAKPTGDFEYRREHEERDVGSHISSKALTKSRVPDGPVRSRNTGPLSGSTMIPNYSRWIPALKFISLQFRDCPCDALTARGETPKRQDRGQAPAGRRGQGGLAPARDRTQVPVPMHMCRPAGASPLSDACAPSARAASPSNFRCGRDDGHPSPPAQNRTCRVAAYGSHLGWVASKRTFGCGCRMRALGSHRLTRRRNRAQVIGRRWLRRRSARNQCRRTWLRKTFRLSMLPGTAW